VNLFRKNKYKNINYLELTPVPNYKYEVKDKGMVDVLVPRFKNKYAEKIFIPKSKSPYIRANLDELGSEVWKLLNGENKVSFIVERLNEIFGEKIQPVNERLTKFLSQLYKNGFISFKEIERNK
jgi:hypothetical protein